MCVLNLLVLLLVAIRPTRSVTTKPGHGWGEPLSSGQANAAIKIASSTCSDTMSLSQEWAMLLDETNHLHFPAFEYSALRSNFLQSSSLLTFDFSNGVDQFGERSSMKKWGSSPASSFDASHVSIDSQRLSQKGQHLDCLIESNRIPSDSEILSSKEVLENLVPDNTNSHQFGDSSSKNLADWNPNTSPNRDASRISNDGQQSIERVEGKTSDCCIENTINSRNQPVDVRENIVPDGFPQRTHKMVYFRNSKYLMGLRMLSPLLNWDLDEVKDYDSLCVFLGKETNPEQVDFHNSVAMTEHIMKLLVERKSGRDNVEIGQKNIDAPNPKLIGKANSTPEKLIRISNFVLKLVSCRRSGCSINPNVISCFKRVCIPVLHCLVKCCGKDINVFQTRWGTRFPHHIFGVNCCPGRGLKHNTCGYLRTKVVINPDNRDNDSDLLDLKALVVAVSTSKTVEEKLNLCWKFNEKFRSCGPIARKPFLAYHNQTPRPIWGCFVHHCGEDAKEWIRKWGSRFPQGSFGSRKCHGLETFSCGSIDPPFDIPARHELRSRLTRNLLPALSKIFEEYDHFVIAKTTLKKSPHPDLTTFIKKCRPIYNCLHRHCAGSVEEFARRWGEPVYCTSFSRNCCPGPDKRNLMSCQYNSHPKVL